MGGRQVSFLMPFYNQLLQKDHALVHKSRCHGEDDDEATMAMGSSAWTVRTLMLYSFRCLRYSWCSRDTWGDGLSDMDTQLLPDGVEIFSELRRFPPFQGGCAVYGELDGVDIFYGTGPAG